MNNDKDIFWILPIILLILAVFNMPSGYYVLLRIVVFVCSIYFLIKYMNVKNETMTWVFGILAIIYNPLIPVYLYNKTLWFIINLITIAIFFQSRKILVGVDSKTYNYFSFLSTIQKDIGDRGIGAIIFIIFFFILYIFDL